MSAKFNGYVFNLIRKSCDTIEQCIWFDRNCNRNVGTVAEMWRGRQFCT